MNKTSGLVLIFLGILGLAWGTYTYTTREKIVDIGPIHATHDEEHSSQLPAIAGAVALVGGVVLLLTAAKA
jgi:hypothetical protein